MEKDFYQRFVPAPALWALAGLLAVLPTTASAQMGYQPPRPGITDSISSSIKGGADRIGQAVTPPKQPADDPILLRTKAKPGVELYVAMARFYEEANRFKEAEEQYQRALKESPKDLRALLGYAKLKDRLGLQADALKLYEQAAKAQPQEPSVYNNLAVHFARRGMLREAAEALSRAIQLRPKEIRYRNNMATLLVEMGRPQDAFIQLHAVFDEGVAHYNLGFLLNKKGQTAAAAQEFAAALRCNPSLVQAQQWLERLAAATPRPPQPTPYGQQPGGPYGSAEQPRMASRPAQPYYPPQPAANAWPEPPRQNAVRTLPTPPQQPVEQGLEDRRFAPSPADSELRRLPPVSGRPANGAPGRVVVGPEEPGDTYYRDR